MFVDSSVTRRSAAKYSRWLTGLSWLCVQLTAAALSQELPVASAGSASIEEIVVTARKVEESVQDIPMSVQVLSGEYLDNADLSNLLELQFNVPGLVVNSHGGYGAGFSLRGIADQGGNTLAVATHLNGVYLGTSNLAIARIFDLERIEVLKGPQGTLYGRNSTGGSINFITRAPDDDFNAAIEAAYGSFQTARVQGHVNLPSEKANLRLAFIGSQGDGYIRNSVDDRKFAEDDFWGLRGSLQLELTDTLDLSLVVQHVIEDGGSGDLWLPNLSFLPDPADILLTRVTLADPSLQTENNFIDVSIGYELGFASLQSVTGYARSDVHNKDDCAGFPFLQGCVREIGPDKYSQWSQEFRLVSPGDAALDWIAGAYYFNSDASSNYYLLAPVIDPNPQNDAHSTLDEIVFAIFGQASLQLSDRWSTTAGLRLSREESRVSDVGTGINDNQTLVVADDSWDHVSWRLDLEFAATEDLLVYAGVSTGLKSGGFTTDLLSNGELDSFDPEKLIAYEAGIKSQWLDRRLTVNGAAFFYDFEDMQVTTAIIDNNVPAFVTDNAAKAEIYGIDIAGTFRVSDRLTLSGGLVWLPKRDFVEYTNAQTGDTLSGNKLSRVPEWTATAAIDYTHLLRAFGSLSTRLEYNYRSDFYYTKENVPLFSQDGFGLLNVILNYNPASEKWYVFASGRNLTNERYFTQVFIQASPGYPDTYEVGFGLRF